MTNIAKPVRYAFRLATAFVTTHRKIIIVGIVMSILFALLTPKVITFIDRRPLLRRVGLVGMYTVDTLPRNFLTKISIGLTKIEPDGSFSPELAKSWQVSDDATRYTFKLDSGYMWHDDTPLLSTDLMYNFTDVSVTMPDPMTIEFQLKEPFAPFPSIASWPVFKKGLTGIGECRVESIKRNGKIIEQMTLYSPVSHQRTIYKFYPTAQAAKTAFKLGEIDVLEGLEQPEEIQMWPNAHTEATIDYTKVMTIFFNTDHGLLTERAVRQALGYALKKNWPDRAYGPISPKSWAYNTGLKTYDYNPEKSLELLSGILGEDQKIELTLTTFSSLYPLAEEITSEWQKIGVNTQIKTVDFVPTEFEALLFVLEIPPDPDQYVLWHSTQQTNLSRLKSPQIDKLLEVGRQTVEFEQRKDIYFDFQRFLVEETPALFLYHPETFSITRA